MAQRRVSMKDKISFKNSSLSDIFEAIKNLQIRLASICCFWSVMWLSSSSYSLPITQALLTVLKRGGFSESRIDIIIKMIVQLLWLMSALFVNAQLVDMRGGATLKVTHPPGVKAMFKDGRVKASLGNFGHIQYGSTLIASLMHPADNSNGCDVFPSFFQHKAIILVDAGGCPITQKVRNIQNAGGLMALIGDALYEDVEEVWMEDVDGSGFSLIISGMMISKDDAYTFKTALKSGKSITLQAQLEIAHATSQSVELGLWYGSILDIPIKLVEELYDYQHLMKSFVIFTPRIVTMQCPNCVGEVRDRECLSSGLYCLMPPKDAIGTKYPEISDKALMLENLRSKCVFETTKVKSQADHDDLKFFNYLYNMRHDCVFENKELNNWCANDVMQALKIDTAEVDVCMQNSFKSPSDYSTDNMLLYQDKLLAEVYGMSRHPALTINGQIYRGDMTGYDVFKAICSSFQSQTRPKECEQSYDLQLGLGHAKEEFKPTWKAHLRAIFVGCMLFNCCALLCYQQCKKRRNQLKMQNKVQQHVTQYFQLREVDENGRVSGLK